MAMKMRMSMAIMARLSEAGENNYENVHGIHGE